MKHVRSLTRFLILVLLITSQAGYAQQQDSRVISGIVKDPDGNPLPGVQIVIENTNIGTISSENGRFSITSTVSEPTLVFSFIGLSNLMKWLRSVMELNREKPSLRLYQSLKRTILPIMQARRSNKVSLDLFQA